MRNPISLKTMREIRDSHARKYKYVKVREEKILNTMNAGAALTPEQIADKTGLALEVVIATLLILDAKNKVWRVGNTRKYLSIKNNPRKRTKRKKRRSKIRRR